MDDGLLGFPLGLAAQQQIIGCHLTNSASYNVADSFSYDTDVPFDIEVWKHGVLHDTAVENNEVTIVSAGWYLIACYVQCSVSSVTGGLGVRLEAAEIGGSWAGSAFSQINNQGTSGNNYNPTWGFCSVKTLRAGQKLRIRVAQKSGSVRAFAATGSDLYIAMIGARAQADAGVTSV